MKLQLLSIVFLTIPFISTAQTYRLTVGDEIKIKKGTSDVDIVAADNTGIYVAENRIKGSWSFTHSYDLETRLIKFDAGYQEVYAKDYNKELDDYGFHSFHTVGNELFLLAKGYVKKEKAYKVVAAKIDKSTGNLATPLKELGSYSLEDKDDVYLLRGEAVDDGKRLLLVSNVSAKDRMHLVIDVVDENLQKKQSVTINLAFAPGHYAVEDVKLTANNQVVLLGREMQEVTLGKKKPKLVFKQFRLTVYDAKGNKLKEVVVDAGNRFVINGKLIQQVNKEMLLAGLYSNDAAKTKLNGFFISKLNSEKGELTATSFKEITKPVPSTTDTTAKGEEFGNQYNIRTVDENLTDGSYIITAEAADYTTWEQSEMERQATGTVMRYYTWHRFTNADLLIINAEKTGDIRWLSVLPKTQIEEFRSTGSSAPFASAYTNYFAQGGGMPYYSSYKTMLRTKQLLLLFNDNTENRGVQPGNTAKPVSDFVGKSSLYSVAVDLISGKMIRKAVTANSEDLLLMPRHSYVTDNDVIIPSMRGRVLAKTVFKLARVSVK